MARPFSDQTNPGCDPHFATILRLYESYFGRPPDTSGANFWLSEYAEGRWTLPRIKNFFANSPEFHQRYDGLSSAQFVRQVYLNVFKREPDLGGRLYWTARLIGGLSRARFIDYIADSQEFRNAHPYAPSRFCQAATIHGYAKSNPFPGVVHLSNGSVHVFFLEKGKFRVSPGSSKQRPGSWGGSVAINGNWFGSPHTFYGWSVAYGRTLGYENGDARHAWIGEDENGDMRFAHTNGTVPIPDDIKHAVTGKLMVANGGLFTPSTSGSSDPTMRSRLPRTGLGIHRDGYVVKIVVDGRSKGPGMTSTELGRFMISLGIQNGIMLDGGGSSAAWLKGKGIVNRPSDGSVRPVPNQAVYLVTSDWVS